MVHDDIRAAASAAGREFVKLRRRVEGICAECGAPFFGYQTKRYCSSRCHMRGWRKEKRKEASELRADPTSEKIRMT